MTNQETPEVELDTLSVLEAAKELYNTGNTVEAIAMIRDSLGDEAADAAVIALASAEVPEEVVTNGPTTVEEATVM